MQKSLMERIDIASALEFASQRLKGAGIPDPTREASSLLVHCLDRPRAFLIAHPEYLLSPGESSTYKAAIDRRVAREPFQLIVGRQEFYGLDFEVEAGVLIPRPETEAIVERAIDILLPMADPTFLELGVGTGCISVSLLKFVTSARGTAVDISRPALALAARNAQRHDVLDRLDLIESDLFGRIEGAFDLIVSNPPYIPTSEAEGLQPEVMNFDPPAALFAGTDGLNIIVKIVAGSPRFLKRNGFLIIEIGHGQAEDVKSLFGAGHWSHVEFIDDLQGIPRTVVARLGRRS